MRNPPFGAKRDGKKEYNTSKSADGLALDLLRRFTFDEHTVRRPLIGELAKIGSNNKIIILSNLEFINAVIMLRRRRGMLERHFMIQELTRYRLRLDQELSTACDMQR